ncbi:MAG: hypothetical protein M1823_004638 [Watsoniomyces obsoletus]|nr:MAG: hypothetical protein M1823_004638 [Watsoniomyces obsoletus]
MVKDSRKALVSTKEAHYEFGGPLSVFAMTVALPLVCYAITFFCNDVSGCPVPSLLHPSTLSWNQLKQETGWPEGGLSSLIDLRVVGAVLGYYALSLLMQVGLAGQEVEGVELRSGGRLKYKFNAFNSAVVILTAALVGTITQGADFPVWTFIWDNYASLLTVNILLAYSLATWVYIRSFSVKPGNRQQRELAQGGSTGNLIYDWFIGRELNPRINIPLFGPLDIKVFLELRPGMLGWILLDLAFVAHQYKTHGYITDSIILITLFQTIYVLDALWNEPAILTTMDITTDGFGFMLAFGDCVWVPFIYSLQTRYLAVHPVQLGLLGTLGVLTVQGIGYYIFRGANNEKNIFRTNPSDPRVSHLKSMTTSSGSRLLTSGWWGQARHVNYLGDWIMAWAWCLPTGLAGYLITQKIPETFYGGTHPSEDIQKIVVPDDAKGWGMLFTYFYVLYFGILLVHRERRDEEKCRRKYGTDWELYKQKVPSRIIPGVY